MSNRAHQLRQVESVIFLCVPISQCKALLDTSFGQHRFENYSWWNCLFWIYWIFKWIVNPTFIKMDLFLSGWKPTQVLKDVVRTGKENRGINYNNREIHWPLKIRIKKGIAGMVIWPPPPHSNRHLFSQFEQYRQINGKQVPQITLANAHKPPIL